MVLSRPLPASSRLVFVVTACIALGLAWGGVRNVGQMINTSRAVRPVYLSALCPSKTSRSPKKSFSSRYSKLTNPRGRRCGTRDVSVNAHKTLILVDENKPNTSLGLTAANFLTHKLHNSGSEVHMLVPNAEYDIYQLPTELTADWEKRDKSVTVVSQDNRTLEEAISKIDLDIVVDFTHNQTLTESLIRIARSKGVKRYIYVSPTSVYGPECSMPCSEDSEVIPVEFTSAKINSETLLQDSGLPYTIIRSGLVIGPERNDMKPLSHSLENYFFHRHALGKPIVVPGHGQYMVSLLHAKDLASGIASALETAQAEGQIYNLQADGGITFDGLAELTAKISNRNTSLEVIHYDERQFEWIFCRRPQFPLVAMGHSLGFTEKAKKELNWKPSFTISNALADSYENGFQILFEDNLQPDLNLGLDEAVISSPHKQVQVQWLFPVTNFRRPLGYGDDIVVDTGNKWEWE